jgi:2-oxoisovalerate dehydrogenase E1 component
MALDPSPAAALDAAFRTAVAALGPPAPDLTGPEPSAAPRVDLGSLFLAQARSRQLDLVARELRASGSGFYTIGSAGHEGNALLALALRADDPALLHYRSGGFYCARADRVPGSTPVRDVLLGLLALAEEPIAGGRHKVFGRRELAIIPQTSTIASHLPRAVGLAISLHRAERLGVASGWPADAVVVCSFGDASANHSTATGAINTALNTRYRGLAVPILFVCEDNGWGISVPTPHGWIEAAYGSRTGLPYFDCDGADPEAAWPVITDAVSLARAERRPVFLRLRTVRYLAHAGSDAEIGYRRPREIAADYVRDPLLGTARALIESRAVKAAEVLARYDQVGADVAREAAALAGGRRLSSATEIMAPLAPHRPAPVRQAAAALRGAPRTQQTPVTGCTLAESITTALAGILEVEGRALVFGEDVGAKGGVYGVTRGLQRRFGAARVFDTLLDEQAILGLALGAGLANLIPIPEIQYLAYLHNAEDQLRGEAATLPFFSSGQYANPMVVRVPGLAYQQGFGGHFHNDNALGVLRDIPGLVVACPARGSDAAAMLRTCVAAATTDGGVSVFLEPIALYHVRDLYEPGDARWLADDRDEHIPIGRARAYGPEVADLTLVTFGNGVRMSLRTARRLATLGLAVRVLDLRWLAPLPRADLLAEAGRTGRVLVVDETRHSGGVGEGVLAALVEGGFLGPMARVASLDSFVPLGPAAAQILLSEDEIEKAATELAGRGRG